MRAAAAAVERAVRRWSAATRAVMREAARAETLGGMQRCNNTQPRARLPHLEHRSPIATPAASMDPTSTKSRSALPSGSTRLLNASVSSFSATASSWPPRALSSTGVAPSASGKCAASPVTAASSASRQPTSPPAAACASGERPFASRAAGSQPALRSASTHARLVPAAAWARAVRPSASLACSAPPLLAPPACDSSSCTHSTAPAAAAAISAV